MRRVEFNSGEGLDETDLNMVQQLVERNLDRWVIQPLGYQASVLVQRVYGGTIALSGTGNHTVTMAAAKYLLPLTPATSDDPNFRVGDFAGAAFTLDAPTSGVVYRRDIIQVKVEVDAAGTPTSRDFEDAVTRALTTATPNKRRTASCTVSVVKGVDQVDQATADLNEPAVTAGYTKVWSVLVPPTGSVSASFNLDYNAPLYAPITAALEAFVHGTRVLHLPAIHALVASPASALAGDQSHVEIATSGFGTVLWGIPVEEGWTILSLGLLLNTSGTVTTRTFRVGWYGHTAGVLTWGTGSYSTTAIATSSRYIHTLDIPDSLVVAPTVGGVTGIGTWFAQYAGGAGDDVWGLKVTYKRL